MINYTKYSPKSASKKQERSETDRVLIRVLVRVIITLENDLSEVTDKLQRKVYQLLIQRHRDLLMEARRIQ